MQHPADGVDDVERHFALHDICTDDNVAVCATVSIVIVFLCTSGLYAAIYTAYQVIESSIYTIKVIVCPPVRPSVRLSDQSVYLIVRPFVLSF